MSYFMVCTDGLWFESPQFYVNFYWTRSAIFVFLRPWLLLQLAVGGWSIRITFRNTRNEINPPIRRMMMMFETVFISSLLLVHCHCCRGNDTTWQYPEQREKQAYNGGDVELILSINCKVATSLHREMGLCRKNSANRTIGDGCRKL